jgi:hypothetical protein
VLIVIGIAIAIEIDIGSIGENLDNDATFDLRRARACGTAET